MKQAICIQCHKNPSYINKMISLFPDDKFDFFIHIDKKSDIYSGIEKKKNVFILPQNDRINVHWGQFSQVEASLALFHSLRPLQYSYVHLVSGEDAPIKEPEALYELLLDDHAEYIQSNPLPGDSTWTWGGQDRFLVYYPSWIIQRPANQWMKAVRIAYREFVMRTGIGRRKHFPVDVFYGGSSWFSVTGKCLDWMMEYINYHPDLIKFFRNMLCADEIFFQTIVRLGPYADKIANHPARFMIWEGTTSGGPLVLRKENIPEIKEAKKVFFARKVNSVEVLEMIETELLDNG